MAPPPPSTTSSLTTKALERLQASLDDGNPYEGHEMLKTSYYRARSKNKFADSYDMCAHGAVKHFAGGDYQCGVELGTMLLDSYKTDGVAFGDESCARVLLVVNGYTKLREKDVERSAGGEGGLSQSRREAAAGNSDSVSMTDTLIAGMQQLKDVISVARQHAHRLANHPLAKFFESVWWWMIRPLGLTPSQPTFSPPARPSRCTPKKPYPATW